MRRPLVLLVLLALSSPLVLADHGDGQDPASDVVFNFHASLLSPPLVGEACSAPASDLVATGATADGTTLRLWVRALDLGAPATCPGLEERVEKRLWWGDFTAYRDDPSLGGMIEFGLDHRSHGLWAEVRLSMWSEGYDRCALPWTAVVEGDEIAVTVPLVGEAMCDHPLPYDLTGHNYFVDGELEVHGVFQVPGTGYTTYDRTWDAPGRLLG